MIQGDLTFEVARGEVLVFCGSIRSHREQDPPVRLQRLGGTVNQLIMAHQGFFQFFWQGRKSCLCFFPSILWEQGGPLGVKGGTVDGWQEESGSVAD